jgi:glucosamine--fructose-6-phosphate aminotransferase (isomerizing)
LFTIYERPPRLDKALVIGISQSGQSPDILSVVTECRRQGGATLALTNDSGSPLARAAELHVSLAAGEERAVAATKTYTNELMALAMLSVALEADAHRKEQALALPDHVEAALAVEPVLAELGATFRNASKFLVIGRGYNYSTAFEVALKIKETSYVIAEPYSTADLLHGPVAMVDEGFPVVVIAPSGRAVAEVPKLLELLHSRRARVAVLSDREELLAQADAAVRLPSEVPEWLSPITSVVPGQLLALHLALGRGLDPDAPRGLSKVTLTK